MLWQTQLCRCAEARSEARDAKTIHVLPHLPHGRIPVAPRVRNAASSAFPFSLGVAPGAPCRHANVGLYEGGVGKLSAKGQIINILGFVGHTGWFEATQLWSQEGGCG